MGSHYTSLSLRARNPEIVAALLDDGIDIRLRLSGSSMKPLVRTGSVLEFSAGSRPRVGDIVLMRFHDGPNAKLVAHRVLAMDGELVWTKGDSSATMDPPISRSRVLATATALDWRHSWSIPLANAAMRRLGLAVSFLYPKLVHWYRTVHPRKEAFLCGD